MDFELRTLHFDNYENLFAQLVGVKALCGVKGSISGRISSYAHRGTRPC